MAADDEPAVPIILRSLDERDEAVSNVLFYSIGEGAIMIDERGNIARINQIALDILGFKATELLGKWYPSALVAEDEEGNVIPNLDRPVTEAFLSGKPVPKRLYYRKKGGERIPVSLNVAPIMLRDKPIGAIELFRDITDELQLERAKDEFISIASHQLRTPASVVKQNLGMILEGYADSKKQQSQMIQIAYDHNNNQLEIINNLLNIARVEASKLTPNLQDVDLIALMKKVIKGQFTERKARQIGIQLIARKSPVMICVDPIHLQMVFENLIINALKFSPRRTKVTIRVMTTVKTAIVRVTDQGIGIATKDLPHLFKKFSRIENVNSTASGTGLGLYWAKKLIELHHGKISVSSRLHKGTTFIVTLPLGDS